MNVVCIGSGNVASHLCLALKEKVNIVQIASKHICNAKRLATVISSHCKFTDSVTELANADVYILSIKDDEIQPFLKTVPFEKRDALWIHTSGSIPVDVFSSFNKSNGVLYPLQTFSKEVRIDVSDIPFFIEGNSDESRERIKSFAMLLSKHVFYADSLLREQLHVAAVFACNFTNFMYTLANDILQKNGLSFSVLSPLVHETLRKAGETNAPDKVQTGPARRGDQEIIKKHISLLENDSQKKEIYQILSEYILNRYNK